MAKFDIEAVTAADVDRGLARLREIEKAAFWAPATVRAYNRADCTSITVRDADGWTYHASFARAGNELVSVEATKADLTRYFVAPRWVA